MEIPKLEGRILTEFYGLNITPLMKKRLAEMKAFHGVNVPEMIRWLIQKEIDRFDTELIITGQKIVEVLTLPQGKDL